MNWESPFGEFPREYFNRQNAPKTNEKQQKEKSVKKDPFQSGKTVTDFKKYYDRGDIPITVLHSGSINKIKWNIAPDKVDITKLLPLFCTGLVEKYDPYRILAIMGSFELIEYNTTEVIQQTLPLIIMPLKIALNTRDQEIMVIICKLLQKMLHTHPKIGVDLVPYYR